MSTRMRNLRVRKVLNVTKHQAPSRPALTPASPEDMLAASSHTRRGGLQVHCTQTWQKWQRRRQEGNEGRGEGEDLISPTQKDKGSHLKWFWPLSYSFILLFPLKAHTNPLFHSVWQCIHHYITTYCSSKLKLCVYIYKENSARQSLLSLPTLGSF